VPCHATGDPPRGAGCVAGTPVACRAVRNVSPAQFLTPSRSGDDLHVRPGRAEGRESFGCRFTVHHESPEGGQLHQRIQVGHSVTPEPQISKRTESLDPVQGADGIKKGKMRDGSGVFPICYDGQGSEYRCYVQLIEIPRQVRHLKRFSPRKIETQRTQIVEPTQFLDVVGFINSQFERINWEPL